MTNTQKRFELHLPGLLKVLAEHLYSARQVAVRELIQNAHDSCLRRAAEQPQNFYRPRVTLRIDQSRQTLIIEDNGCGLTAEEIETYLATIGRSYTRELRERLALLSWDEAARLIGQFGFGFLSAFLIAAEVTLQTRSYKPDSPALRWVSQGDETYTLSPGERAEPGTTIELRLKPAASFLLQERILIETARTYADMLPIPIHVGRDPQPINLMQPPWLERDPLEAARFYIERAFQIETPLAIIPLHDQTVDLGHDSLTLPLQGFLFIPPASRASVHEFGDLRVFIRRMFIRDDERDLLPAWARFVRGVIDCPQLQPTASREAIHQDETFAAIQQALADQLTEGLRLIARDEPAVWRQIIQAHSELILNWAGRDRDFFAQVADLLPLRTSRGRLTMPEYLKLTGGTLYYTIESLGSLQEQMLAESQDVPVIEASWVGVQPFLEQYAQQHPEVQPVRLDGDAQRLLRPIGEAPFAALLGFYRAQGVRVRVAAFKPAAQPAIMLYPRDADTLLEVRRSLENDEFPDAFAGLVRTYADSRREDMDMLGGTLYLNASCPLIQQLAEQPPHEATLHATLTLIYQLARLFAGHTLTALDAANAFAELTGALGRLVEE
ncbi:MAG: ATP-binding protein [Roseiflexaceae bacterium]